MHLEVDAAVAHDGLVAGDVRVEDGVIAELGLPPAGSGLLAAPGFVDLQVNGWGGIDLLSTDADGVREISNQLLRTGVTAWQPTLITAAEDTTVAALQAIDQAVQYHDPQAARILGVHLEGPFLAPSQLGAHPAQHRRNPDLQLLDRLLAAGPVSSMTVAPELPGALELIEELRRRGIVVSLGHSEATSEQAHAAFDRGVRTVTHLFNAMRSFTHRQPGLAGAALARSGSIVQLIVDGHHLAGDTVRIVWGAAPGRVALVTDAVAATQAPPGPHPFGETEVRAEDGAARLPDGNLAGSLLSMPEAVANLEALGVPAVDAIHAATSVPARVLGRRDVGALRPGARADAAILDADGVIRRVLLAGERVEPLEITDDQAATPG